MKARPISVFELYLKYANFISKFSQNRVFKNNAILPLKTKESYTYEIYEPQRSRTPRYSNF